MSGALAERVFADKLSNVGFTAVAVRKREPFSLADAARYPLFTPELIELMERLLPPAGHAEVAIAVTVSAQKPAGSAQ